jgi:hypothetical protein
MTKTTYAPFDAADYLDNDAVIAEYLSAAVDDPNPDVFLAALGDAGKYRKQARPELKSKARHEATVMPIITRTTPALAETTLALEISGVGDVRRPPCLA